MAKEEAPANPAADTSAAGSAQPTATDSNGTQIETPIRNANVHNPLLSTDQFAKPNGQERGASSVYCRSFGDRLWKPTQSGHL